MRSDGSPDPTILGQINTFLNVNQSSPEKLEINMLRDDVVLILSVGISNEPFTCKRPGHSGEWMPDYEQLLNLESF